MRALKSKTTRDVGASGAASILIVNLIITAIERAGLPVGAELEMLLLSIVGGALTTLGSRLLAWLRGKTGGGKGRGSKAWVQYALIAALLPTLALGCATTTTTYPDGRVVEESGVDWERVEEVSERSLVTLKSLRAQYWLEYQETGDERYADTVKRLDQLIAVMEGVAPQDEVQPEEPLELEIDTEEPGFWDWFIGGDE
jgi:hypothetical protein